MELPKFFKERGGIEEVRRTNTKRPKSIKERAALGRTVLDGEGAEATIHPLNLRGINFAGF